MRECRVIRSAPDHLGSTTFVSDSEGNEYEHLEYTPYGETWIEEVSNPNVISYKFTSKELDEETGLYYFGARYLDPATGRWLSTDPALVEYLPEIPVNQEAKKRNDNLPGMGGIFNIANLSIYHYGFNNPVRYIDPNGELSIDDINKLQLYLLWRGAHAILDAINDKGTTTSFLDSLTKAILGFNNLEVQGQALELIKQDPQIIAKDTELIQKALKDPNYGTKEFTFQEKYRITFGGTRGEVFPPDEKTMKVAQNELTWLFRNINIIAVVEVNKKGDIIIKHEFENLFDLRKDPNNPRKEYDMVVDVLGFLWHDVGGISDKITHHAYWETIF